MSIAERILIAAAAVAIFCWVAWSLTTQVVLANLRLQAELVRCQQAPMRPPPPAGR
jgi:hypothetical protein